MLLLRVTFKVLFRGLFKVSVRVAFKVSLWAPCRSPFSLRFRLGFLGLRLRLLGRF